MFRTIGGLPFRRPVALVLAGALLAATLIPPVVAQDAGSSAPALTTYTRSASCPGLSFYPEDSATGYSTLGTLRTTRAAGGGSLICDPGLPNGAVVTKVQFTVRDVHDTFNVTCGFHRSGLTTVTATSSDLLAGYFESSGEPGVERFTDVTIDFPTINNARFGYWLQCYLDASDFGLGIYGANVIYRISAAKG